MGQPIRTRLVEEEYRSSPGEAELRGGKPDPWRKPEKWRRDGEEVGLLCWPLPNCSGLLPCNAWHNAW